MESYDTTEDLKWLNTLDDIKIGDQVPVDIWNGNMGSLIEKIGASSKKLSMNIEKNIHEGVDVIGFNCLDGIRIFERDPRKGFVVGNPFGPAELSTRNGSIYAATWFRFSEAIRADGPAHISKGGYLHWTNAKGQWHREGAPAIIEPNILYWYENHKFIKLLRILKDIK